MVEVSVVIPTFNEEKTVGESVTQVEEVFQKNKFDGEVVVVDDGSTDNSKNVLNKLKRDYYNLKIFSHRVNLGKSEALMTGFRESEGKIILFLDADLQYNANDIPLFLKKIDEGFDVVNGWRVERKDGLSRIIPSKAYNLLTNLILGPSLHDHNCGMKAFKKGVVEYILLRTDQHRYITSLAHKLGYRVCEVRIHHNPRMHGKPKFNSPVRFFTGLIDLIAVQFQLSYLYKPLLFFVPLGLSLLSIGAISSFYILYLYLTVDFPGGILKYHLPLIVLTSLVILFGLVVIVFSLLAEMVSIIKRDVDFIKEQLRK